MRLKLNIRADITMKTKIQITLFKFVQLPFQSSKFTFAAIVNPFVHNSYQLLKRIHSKKKTIKKNLNIKNY